MSNTHLGVENLITLRHLPFLKVGNGRGFLLPDVAPTSVGVGPGRMCNLPLDFLWELEEVLVLLRIRANIHDSIKNDSPTLLNASSMVSSEMPWLMSLTKPCRARQERMFWQNAFCSISEPDVNADISSTRIDGIVNRILQIQDFQMKTGFFPQGFDQRFRTPSSRIRIIYIALNTENRNNAMVHELVLRHAPTYPLFQGNGVMLSVLLVASLQPTWRTQISAPLTLFGTL